MEKDSLEKVARGPMARAPMARASAAKEEKYRVANDMGPPGSEKGRPMELELLDNKSGFPRTLPSHGRPILYVA